MALYWGSNVFQSISNTVRLDFSKICRALVYHWAVNFVQLCKLHGRKRGWLPSNHALRFFSRAFGNKDIGVRSSVLALRKKLLTSSLSRDLQGWKFLSRSQFVQSWSLCCAEHTKVEPSRWCQISKLFEDIFSVRFMFDFFVIKPLSVEWSDTNRGYARLDIFKAEPIPSFFKPSWANTRECISAPLKFLALQISSLGDEVSEASE